MTFESYCWLFLHYAGLFSLILLAPKCRAYLFILLSLAVGVLLWKLCSYTNSPQQVLGPYGPMELWFIGIPVVMALTEKSSIKKRVISVALASIPTIALIGTISIGGNQWWCETIRARKWHGSCGCITSQQMQDWKDACC